MANGCGFEALTCVLLRCRRESHVLEQLGEMHGLVIEYEGASLIAQQIDDDCLVVIELSPSANVSKAMFRLEPVVRMLRRELTL